MQKVFEHAMKVRSYELDAQGVVNNANYMHYFEVARHEMMEACGLSFGKLTDEGIFPMVRRANIQYKHSLRDHDLFVCRIRIQREGVRYIFLQEIIKTSDNRLCAKAEIEVACLVKGKVAPPEIFDNAFAQYIEWR